jgi:hypothetical protein
MWVAGIKRYFENPANWEHIIDSDVEHIWCNALGYSTPLTGNELSRMRQFPRAFGLLATLPQAYIDLRARAGQIADEFYNYRCTAYACGHFVAQTEASRTHFVARVKRYFENPANWEHIQNEDVEQFYRTAISDEQPTGTLAQDIRRLLEARVRPLLAHN